MKLIALFAASASAFAGAPLKSVQTPAEPGIQTYIRGESTYSADADYEGKLDAPGRQGEGSVWSGRFQLGIVKPVSGISLLSNAGGAWQLRLGIDHERFEFDHNSTFPLPSQLQRIAGVIALEYRVGKQIGSLIEARPGVHFESDIGSNAWNCPVLIGMGIPLTDRFTLALAGRIDPLGRYTIIGGPGFIWKISETVTLTAIPPEPRITWAASENLDLWLGGEWTGGSFRTDSRTDNRNLSEAVVSYSEFRAGIGARWRSGTWSIETGAGLSLEREWDYHRADRRFSTDGTAPYFKLAARAEW